jgi:nucleoside-diphosphate-sugar epimerase
MHGKNSVWGVRGRARRGEDFLRHLITGGAGFIGSHLADALAARGDEILILDDLSTGGRGNVNHLLAGPRVELVEGSVLDEGLVDDCMAAVDTCFHLASTVGVKLVVDAPLACLLRIVRGTDNVTACAARHDRRLLITSTSEIYGKRQDGVVNEHSDRLLGAASVTRWNYATAKAFGEALAFGYHREYGSEMVVVRIFNTVGPRQTGAYGMVLPRFVRQALSGKNLTVYGDGSQSRCFTHVDDTVDALVRLIDCDPAIGDVFNVGSQRSVRIIDLAQRVIEHAGSSSKLEFVPYEQAYGEGFEELGCRMPDTSALTGLTGWEPQRSVDDAIDHVIRHEVASLGAANAANGNGLPAAAKEAARVAR